MEAAVILGLIGAMLGLAAAGVWFAIDLLLGASTIGLDQAGGLALLGGILVHAAVGLLTVIWE